MILSIKKRKRKFNKWSKQIQSNYKISYDFFEFVHFEINSHEGYSIGVDIECEDNENCFVFHFYNKKEIIEIVTSSFSNDLYKWQKMINKLNFKDILEIHLKNKLT